MEKKYRVTGNFNGQRIEEEVSAVSERQAQLRAGFKSKLGGKTMREYMKCKMNISRV